MVRLVGLEPTTGKTPVDFKPTAYANFATAAPATRPPENNMAANEFGESRLRPMMYHAADSAQTPRILSRL